MPVDGGMPMRKQILIQATRLFVNRGYSSISMREIAEACAVTKAALYYHFTDKENLFLAILEDYLEEIESVIQASRELSGTFQEKINFMVRSIMSQTPDKRALIRLGSQEMPNLSPQARMRFGEVYYEKFISQIEALIRDGITFREIKPLNPKIATWILLGMMYPFFYPGHGQDMGIPEDTIPLLLSVFFDGVRLK
jgi:AcrR family transcriptional regulator